MAAGLTSTMSVASVNAQAGSILLNLASAIEQINDFQAFLAWYGSSNLQTLGFTSDDAAVLVSAFTDAKKLADIYNGTQTQASTYDFKTFIKQVIGTGIA